MDIVIAGTTIYLPLLQIRTSFGENLWKFIRGAAYGEKDVEASAISNMKDIFQFKCHIKW